MARPTNQVTILKTVHFWIILLLFNTGSSLGQNKVNAFLEPSDSLSINRRNSVLFAEAILATSTLIALNSVWYSDYPKSKFQLKNDNNHWLQMDKAGHVFSSYHLGRVGFEALEWSGASKNQKLLYGASFGFVFLTAVEVLDGHSSQWGFSWGDVAANAGGSLLFVSQELLWHEQRITPKFSFHVTPYADIRPQALGSSLSEQILKDYNGQTYWLSCNIHSFLKESIIPKWFNIAFGYGAEGMITAENQLVNPVFFPEKERTRQFYVSFDVDLTKISTKSHVLKTIFSVFNTVKIPAPTFEINGRGKSKIHGFYF